MCREAHPGPISIPNRWTFCEAPPETPQYSPYVSLIVPATT
jgi:hypothetical protein